jgi:hypothetical protein
MAESLELLGGPASVMVKVDFGSSGARGTNFYLTYGDPNVPGNINTLYFPNPPQLFDFAINIDPDDAGYLDAYQFVFVPELNTNLWVPGLRLAPDFAIFKQDKTFVPGSAIGLLPTLGYAQLDNLVLPVSADVAGILAALPQEQRNQAFITQANITYEVYNGKPISSMVIPGNISVDLVNSLVTVPISIAAMELDQSLGWIPLTGLKTISIMLGIAES